MPMIATREIRNVFKNERCTELYAKAGCMWTNKNKTSRNVKVWAQSGTESCEVADIKREIASISPKLTVKFVKSYDSSSRSYFRVTVPFTVQPE